MSSQEKFLFLLLNKDMLKGSEYEFIASKNENHSLIPEEVERVERLYSEFEQKGWMSEAKMLDEEVFVEEVIEEPNELDSILVKDEDVKEKKAKWYNPLTW